jgi:hypothetical protein
MMWLEQKFYYILFILSQQNHTTTSVCNTNVNIKKSLEVDLFSREWPPCLFVKRVADMFICQEIGRHAYFLIYRRHMIYFQHNTNKNIFLAILEISVTVFSSFFSFDIQFTDVRKDTMVYGKPDCYSFLYHESLIRSILFVSLFRKF